MHLKDEARWKRHTREKDFPPTRFKVDVARHVMETLDKGETIAPDLIDTASTEIEIQWGWYGPGKGMTPRMKRETIAIVRNCHERGEEFWRVWGEALREKLLRKYEEDKKDNTLNTTECIHRNGCMFFRSRLDAEYVYERDCTLA